MKKILILGTGQAQEDIIRALKERGEYVYACSYKSGDAAEKYADEFSLINIVDEDAVYDYVIKNGIEYIYSVGSDVAMPTVAGVAARAGLRSFIDKKTAMICNTKYLLRETLGDDFKGNLRSQTFTEADEELKLDYPIMIKPADSQGQRGVFRIDGPDEFKEHFQAAKGFSRTGKVIAEEFAEGNEISVNTFSLNGEVIFSLVSDRIVWDEFPGGIIHRHLIPSRYEKSPAVIDAINDLVKRVLEKLEIKNGPAYFQIIVSKDGDPKLIEVTPRLDGCHMWQLIKLSTGVDLLKMTMDLLLDQKVEFDGNYKVEPCETEFLCMPPASVFKKDSFDVNNAEYVRWYYDDGATVHSMNGFMEKCGYQFIKR